MKQIYQAPQDAEALAAGGFQTILFMGGSVVFRLFPEEDENKFTWDSIGDVMDGRRNLGESMPVFIYRLFQFTIKDELAKRYAMRQRWIFSGRRASEISTKRYFPLSAACPSSRFS